MKTIRLRTLLLSLLVALFQIKATTQKASFNEVKVNPSNKTFTLERKELTNIRVLLAITIENNAYALPTFLATLETLKCHGDQKCDLWIYFNKSTHRSHDILTYWLLFTRDLFNTTTILNDGNDFETKTIKKETHHASSNIRLKAIEYGLKNNYSHVFFMSAETVLFNPNTIQILIDRRLEFIAPMLKSTDYSPYVPNRSENEEFSYSTFNALPDSFNDELYLTYLNRKKQGCFNVFSIQETFLVDLSAKVIGKLLNLNQVIDSQFSRLLRELNQPVYMCNNFEFGYLPNRLTNEDPESRFMLLRMEHLVNKTDKSLNKALALTKYLNASTIAKETLKNIDRIYMINLKRRLDKQTRMESVFNDLNLSFEYFEAVDGNLINENYLKELGVRIMPNYLDPHTKKPMSYGEIGCFLSHYFIWKQMVENNLKTVIIMEDDARFDAYFKSTINYFVEESEKKHIQWDLLYLGRQLTSYNHNRESFVPSYIPKDRIGLLKPSYTYWTIAYMLTLEGAKKLLDANPLQNLIPVDEFLPIMFNEHINQEWMSYFPIRNLNAYALHPRIIWPTHFKMDSNYISDTSVSQPAEVSAILGADDSQNYVSTHIEL